jgi:hypothetical protein
MAAANLRCLRLLANGLEVSFCLKEILIISSRESHAYVLLFVLVSLGSDIRGIRAIRGLEKMR